MARFWALLLVCLFSSALSDESSSSSSSSSEEDPSSPYAGSQVLKVLKDPKGIINRVINRQHLDVWSGNSTHLDVLVPSEKLHSIKRILRSNRIPFATMIKDLQTALNQQNPHVPVAPRSRAGYRMNWQNYQRLNVIHEFLDTLAQKYPSFVSTGVLGTSVENRPLKYIKISSGKPNAKIVFIDGGIHSREWVASAAATYIIRELVENRDKLPSELKDLDFYILPVLNPDGYEYTHTRDRMWRKNRSIEGRCSGVDLNRNFAASWGGAGTSGNSCDETYRGKAPASEPETKAVVKFLTSISKNLKAYINFHSYGQMILLPFGSGYGVYPKDFRTMMQVGEAAAATIRRLNGARYEVGSIADVIYPATGGTIDWVKAALGTPFTYAIELRDTGSYGFTLPAKYIEPTAKDALEAIKVIAAAAAKA